MGFSVENDLSVKLLLLSDEELVVGIAPGGGAASRAWTRTG